MYVVAYGRSNKETIRHAKITVGYSRDKQTNIRMDKHMIERLKRIVSNKSARNGAWLYLLQFFNMVVPLFTIPYVTRILGAGLYGVFSIALNIIGYLQVLVEYGFGLSATRDVAIKGKENLSKQYTTVIISRVLLTIASIAVGLVYVLINRNNIQLCASFGVLFICLLGYCVQMNWVFQGLQEMKFISIVNIIARTTSTILIFVFVKTSENLLLYCLLYSLSPFLSGWIGCFVAKKRYDLHLIKVTIKDIVEELKNGFYVFTVHLSSRVFGAIGVTFLGMFSTAVEVGIFSAIQKIPNLVILLWSPINQVIYPLSSKKFSQSTEEGLRFVKRIKKYALPAFLMIVIVLSIGSKYIINFAFGAEYAENYYWLIPLLFWILVSIDNNFLGIQTLMASRHDKEYGQAFQIGVAATVLLNLVLSYTLKGFGAAMAPAVSELIFNCLLRWKIWKLNQDGQL